MDPSASQILHLDDPADALSSFHRLTLSLYALLMDHLPSFSVFAILHKLSFNLEMFLLCVFEHKPNHTEGQMHMCNNMKSETDDTLIRKPHTFK